MAILRHDARLTAGDCVPAALPSSSVNYIHTDHHLLFDSKLGFSRILDSLYGTTGFLVSIFTVGINSMSFLWPVYSVQETFPNFLRRPTQVDNMADNADITQSQAANQHQLLSHLTLGPVECRK